MSFEDAVRNEYFEWLYDYVCAGRAHDKLSYKKLFIFLHDIEFRYSIPRDGNRARDGIDLRYRFAKFKDDKYVMDILDGPCSVLEMMVALAVRCEETIMDNTLYGNRTGQWFWSMMYSLGLDYMCDELFDRIEATDIVDTFLDRRYMPDGKGGLFRIKGCPDDLREVEIWVQLCWYLDKFE